MIPFIDAIQEVLKNTQDYGQELINLDEGIGRILDEDIFADRDFPPFDRATKDGVAIKFDSLTSPKQTFKVLGIAQAGSPQLTLTDPSGCIEVMTGAIVPANADTVIMYEHTVIEKDTVSILEAIKKGQNIHYAGSDMQQNEILLKSGIPITASEIGVLASVGKSKVLVKKLPKIAIVATGNELVEVNQKPLPYQIRKSNSHTLIALLQDEKIISDSYHIPDEPFTLKEKLEILSDQYDVLVLSGGVSKGKYDFLPETFEALGVEKNFHKVLQRPGKPFWFGEHQAKKTIIFAFPGNPVSTFVNYHVYFKPWLNKTLGISTQHFTVFLNEPIVNKTDLMRFIGVKTHMENGVLHASTIKTTGSGDLVSLSKIDGFIQLKPKQELSESGQNVPFIPTRRII